MTDDTIVLEHTGLPTPGDSHQLVPASTLADPSSSAPLIMPKGVDEKAEAERQLRVMRTVDKMREVFNSDGKSEAQIASDAKIVKNIAERNATIVAEQEITDELASADARKNKGKMPATVDSNRTKKKIRKRKEKVLTEEEIRATLALTIARNAAKNPALLLVVLKHTTTGEEKSVYIMTMHMMTVQKYISIAMNIHGNHAAITGEYDIHKVQNVRGESTPTDLPNTAEYDASIPTVSSEEFLHLFLGTLPGNPLTDTTNVVTNTDQVG